MAKKMIPAVSYLRTSSASNVGTDKDSDKRQRAAIEAFAKAARFQIVGEHYDKAVSGADPIETRPGFSAVLDEIEANGVRTVIVEDASRLARSQLVMELAVIQLEARGVTVLASNGDNLTETDDPMKVAMRQMAVAFAQLEKARLVAKLASGRKRKRDATGKCEGRKSLVELKPDTVALARRLRRRKPKGGQMSLRAVAAALAAQGHLNERGMPFNPKSVSTMLVR
jgi:DNA invertase Pin-like site-specific DNA recombinase